MKKHKLLIYEVMSKRFRGILLLLGIVLFVLGIYDLFFDNILGKYWFLLWIMLAGTAVLWFYYAILVRRSGLVIAKNYFMLQGPLKKVKFSYGRIESITSTQIQEHYKLEDLKGRERGLVKPYYGSTCVFVQLVNYPKDLKGRERWFPRSLFGTKRRGLLLPTADWMKLSRDLGSAQQAWRNAKGMVDKEDKRSLAAQILDMDYETVDKKRNARGRR